MLIVLIVMLCCIVLYVGASAVLVEVSAGGAGVLLQPGPHADGVGDGQGW